MYVYITTNPGKNVLYTGVTNDLKRRIREHEKNRGDQKSFSGKYYCNKLVFYEEFDSPADAIKRENEIKKLSRAKKLKLIAVRNPKMVFYQM